MTYQGNLRHHCSLYPGQPSVDWFRGQSSILAIVGFIWETRFASGSIAIAVSNRQGTFTHSRNLHTHLSEADLCSTHFLGVTAGKARLFTSGMSAVWMGMSVLSQLDLLPFQSPRLSCSSYFPDPDLEQVVCSKAGHSTKTPVLRGSRYNP